ncbi:hypothetical protein Tco_1514241, partial [Tanacetum coccineum]
GAPVLELLRKEKLYAKFTKSEIWRVKLRRVRAMSMTIQSSVKDKILATSSETSKVENAPAKMLCDLDQQMEKRADDSTDKTKIIRKPSKTGKHGYEERKSTKEAGKTSQSQKVNKWSTLSQLCHFKHPHWSRQARECHVDVKKAQEKRDFTLLSLTEQTQTSQSRIATLAIHVRSFSDLTAHDDSPIIEKLYGHD